MFRTVTCLVFGLSSAKVYFSETFDDGWESRWILSKWKEGEGTQGTWKTATGKWFRDEREDTGLQTVGDGKHFGISATFDPFTNEGKELIIQYQIKYENDLECGGGYIKVGPSGQNLTQFGEDTVYNIMFGPDQCGNKRRTHLIFNYRGKNHLKRDNLSFKQFTTLSHLNRLVLKPDNTVAVSVDGVEMFKGAMAKYWDLLPPREITDPHDIKPDDWVDKAMMDDPTSTKPADWVEEAKLVDPKAHKPDTWDEEEDGHWEPPIIDNPAYRGEWRAKKIVNSKFVGAWKPRIIANPDYAEDDTMYRYVDFGYVGFDLLQVKAGSIIDNIIITDDVAEADAFAKKWEALFAVEKQQKAKEKQEAADAKPKEEDMEAQLKAEAMTSADQEVAGAKVEL